MISHQSQIKGMTIENFVKEHLAQLANDSQNSDIMLNSESTLVMNVSNGEMNRLLAILDEPPKPTPAMRELRAKYGA